MAENREEILANFQGITAIEDVAEAIYHLEEAKWDLLTAINRVMPQDGGVASGINHDTHDVEMIDEDISVITPKAANVPESNDSNRASTSTSARDSNNTPRNVKLQVMYGSKVNSIEMPCSATVNDLKKKCEALFGVPICRQQISGLGGSRATPSAPLAILNVHNRTLCLTAADAMMAEDEVALRLTTTFVLRVHHEGKEYNLKYPGTKTVREVKGDTYSLTDIPVRHQQWSGWPDVVGLDDTVLAMVGLTLPEHELTVARAPVANKPKEYKREITGSELFWGYIRRTGKEVKYATLNYWSQSKIILESSDSDNSSVEETDDAADGFAVEDDMFVEVSKTRLQPLMSEHVDDEAIGCIEFAARFRARYGPNSPSFFEGTLQDAIKEACLKPAKERKLLGVYLHHEHSVLTNVFCAQLLGCETVLQTLAANFVVYGWDLTDTDNSNMLLASIARALGPIASMTVSSIPVDRLPALVLIMRVRGNTEIYALINGNVGPSELVGQLIEAIERFHAARDLDAKQEHEREARQRVKSEQDEAYQMSLDADRAKEETRKQMELEKKQEIERVESERLMEEAKQEALRAVALSRVPAEPPAHAEDTTRIRVRLPPPHDASLERRFHATDTLAGLLDYLASEGFPHSTYKVISSWPRRDLTTEPPSSTLKELKLCPQETIMLEER